MQIRKAKPEDLDSILEIYKIAREFMINSGNPNQWRKEKPAKEQIEADIKNGICNVIYEGDEIHGVFALCEGIDPTYLYIEDGKWLNDEKYVTIHRIASDGNAHGIFEAAMNKCKEYADNIRIDTHEDNKVMQGALKKFGFKRCGIIYLSNGEPRIAFQWKKEVRIETKDLVLKKAEFDDWEPLLRNIWSHEESAKYMLWKVTKTQEEAKARMIRTLEFEEKEKYALIIYKKPKMEAIGFAAMRECEPGVFEEMGVAFGPYFVHKGYGKQVLTAMCEEAKKAGAKEFLASHRKLNVASKALILSCGFEYDYESEEKEDPRTGEKYTIVNYRKKL